MFENLPKLKEFYDKSGYMNNTPADLFEKYLKTGMGGEPMIVDYEKSIIMFSVRILIQLSIKGCKNFKVN